MNLSAPFIKRPIATILLTIGLALSGVAGFLVLPVAPLPMVDLPVINVRASLAGASPSTMASDVATPLERKLGTIAGVNEITSSSSTSSTNITLQFDISKNIDAAARAVQAAINAARADLPPTLRQNPTYNKANPAAQPVMILALTSDTRTPGQIYDAVNNIVSQRLSQVSGVGQVEIGGSSQPAVRVEVSPFALNRFGISLEDVRTAIQSANANRPKGMVQDEGGQRFQIYTSTGGTKAADYAPLIIAYRGGAAVRLSDVASVIDSVSDTRTMGLINGRTCIVVLITQQPAANVIALVDSVRKVLPLLQAQMPADVQMQVASDATTSIRASLKEIEITLAIAIALVVMVVGVFLRRWKATLIPAVATIVSLLGTFGIMYLLGFSLNNISLMALTVASGFVVDDAIVVLENTNRLIEGGMGRVEAALAGARQVGFTVLSMSISLVAVFIPLLFMGGQVGALFTAFAVTLSAAVLISLVVSLTTTPMMCAYLLRSKDEEKPEGRVSRNVGQAIQWLHKNYEHSLDFALSAKPLMMLILAVIVCLNVYLYMAIPKGFFPIQDSGRLNGGLRADQSISSQEMGLKMKQLVAILLKDPAVKTVVGFTGGGRSGGGFLSVDLKPRGERDVGGAAVVARLRPQLAKVTGLTVFLNPQQDFRAGGRQSNATYQYTLKADNRADLKTWAQKLNDAMAEHTSVMTDVNTDQQDNGVEAYVDVDHDSAARLGVNLTDVDNALYDSFGQRPVANIYEDLNQYTVVMETAPNYSLSPEALQNIYVPASSPVTVTKPARSVEPTSDRRRGRRRQRRRHPGQRQHHRLCVRLGRLQRGQRRGPDAGRQPGRPQPRHRQRAEHRGAQDDPALGDREVLQPRRSGRDQPPGRGTGDHHLVQPARRRLAQRRPGRHRPGGGRHPHADQCARRLRRHRQGLRRHLEAGAGADPGGPDRDLHRARHPLREPDPSDHGDLHPAVGGLRRAAHADDLQDGVLDHRADRHLPADRPGEEERHHDHRLRARRAAQPRARRRRGGARGLPAALPPDPDDHAGRRPWRAAAGHRLRRGLGAAPAAGDRHHRRPDRQPAAHPAHHPRGVRLHRPVAASSRRTLPQPPRRPRPGPARMKHTLFPSTAIALVCAALAGCAVGPNYVRPSAPLSPTFKEAAGGWSQAAPADTLDRGDWWTLFGDPTLSGLEAKVQVNNQNIIAAEAAYREARDVVAEQKANLFPTIDLTGSGTKSGTGGGGKGGGTVITGAGGTTIVAGGSGSSTSTQYRASIGASWEPDIWGRIRRTIEAASSNAQASAADLAAAKLSAQAELATDYFGLRAADAEIALDQATVAAYQRSLTIAQNRYNAGVTVRSDVYQAQTQLANAQADLAGQMQTRANFEHAIAVLTGEAPGNFTLAAAPWIGTVPAMPAVVPSALLQRRPDIAGAERRVQAANAQIGVQTAAFFPTVSLTGSYGYAGSELGRLFSGSNSLWSYGASVAETLFDGGARIARVRQAKSAHDQTVAQYRETVLEALQDVENQLAATRVLTQQADLRRQASDAADAAEKIFLNQYSSGTVAYTDVVQAQTAAYSARTAVVQTAAQQQATAVALIQSLGGGWKAGTDPKVSR